MQAPIIVFVYLTHLLRVVYRQQTTIISLTTEQFSLSTLTNCASHYYTVCALLTAVSRITDKVAKRQRAYCQLPLLSRRQTIDKVGQLSGRGLVSKDNRPMKSLNHDTCHLSRHDSDDKKWQTIRTPTLLCCFIFLL